MPIQFRPIRPIASSALAITIAATATLAGCSIAPTHPSLRAAQMVEPIPVRRVVADVDFNGGFLLSPDGKRLLWRRAVGLDAGLATRAVDRPGHVAATPERSFATGHLARPVGGSNFGWLADSRHAYYLKDQSGAENTQIVIFDTQADNFAPWTVTPWPASRFYLLHEGAPGSGSVLFASNRRERGAFDVYRVDLASRQVAEIARNDGAVLNWVVDTDGKLAGRVRQLGKEDGADRVMEILDDADGTWKPLKQWGGFDWWNPLRIDRAARRLIAATNLQRDKTALIEYDLDTGAERILFEHPRVDIDRVVFARGDGAPLAAITTPDYPRIDYLDSEAGKALEAAMQRAVSLAQQQGVARQDLVFARPSTLSADLQRILVRGFSSAGNSEFLYDRHADTVVALRTPPADAERLLAPMEPFSFTASDGLEISGYVVKPKGVSGPVPLVVNIHGGPWVRDYWEAGGFDSQQLLANRGYAVMKVNYRGSAGYGRAFMAAGARQTAERLQDDIDEAVQWAIDRGIADPQRIAVMGGSFGGFSTLMQLIRQPHAYACGINIVGVANWPRIFDTWPSFWRNRHYFEWFYGKADDPADREAMWRGSPLSSIERINVPLLVIHGANDVRVVKQDSDDVVAELTKLGRPVDYLVFENEGHQVRRWRNRLAMWRSIEDFLAGCLGGRSAGFDYYQLMPR